MSRQAPVSVSTRTSAEADFASMDAGHRRPRFSVHCRSEIEFHPRSASSPSPGFAPRTGSSNHVAA